MVRGFVYLVDGFAQHRRVSGTPLLNVT